ncbi:hypothetical protein G9P44_000979 [Scheffersomyces stipitis]|nr:hypothetical protein G9P44_000979 [Scheffersomyces stipitis]
MNASELQQVMSRHSKFNYSISFPSEQLLASKNNFPLWKTRMDQLFEPIGKEFVAYLLPSTNVDTGYTSEDRSAFNSYIEFVLSKTVTEDVRVTLSGESVTGRARWLRLLTLYGTMNHRDVVKYVKSLLTMILNPSLKSKAVKPAIDSLYSFTESYTLDEIKGIQLLATSSAPNLIQNYFHSGSESLTYDDVFQFLAEYEENTTEASTAPSVLAATFSTDSRRPSVDANDPLWNTKCYNCGGRGHRRDVCCSPIRVGKYTGWSTNTSKKRSFNDNERKKQYKSGATANVAVNESAFVLTTTTGTMTSHSPEFIFDSGASIHICHDRSLFWTFKPESGSFVSCAGGVRLPVLGRGSIRFRSADESIVLHEVCYVPECTKNLISVHAAVRVSGSPLTTKVDGIYHPRIGRFGVYRDDLGLSVLDMTPVPPLVSALSVLHNRLGHPHQAIEQQVLRDNYSLADIEKIGDVTKSCASCSEYKKTRSIPKVSHKSDTTTPLQILHSDVSGPHNTPGISSESYFCVLVDDYSKFKWVFPIVRKSDAAHQIIIHIRLLHSFFSTRGGYRVGALRTDNGGEFVNHSLRSFLEQEGIAHQRTVAHNSYQNGTAERSIRSVIDKARTLLGHASVPQAFWPYAVKCAAYLLNRLPSRTIADKTSFELLHLEPPSIDHLRTFGCAAFAYIPEPLCPSKFSPRAVKGVMLGYDSNRSSYLIYELHSHKVVSSNQVSFDESIYPFENSPDHAPTTSASTIPMGVSGVPRFSSDVATTSRAEHISSDEHETSSSDHSRAQSPDMHREDSPATPVSISHNLQPLHSSPAASLSSYDSTDSELARMPSNLLASDSTGGEVLTKHSLTPVISPNQNQRTGNKRKNVPSTKMTKKVRYEYIEDDNEFWNETLESNNDDPNDDTYDEANICIQGHAYQMSVESTESKKVPNTYEEAINSPDSEKWIEAMNTEMAAHSENDTWTLVDLPDKKTKVLGVRWVYTIKDGGKYKARLVVRGFQQRYGVDYKETFAPVIRSESVKLLLALAALYGKKVHQMDVSTAFLNGKIDLKIYMKQPSGYQDCSAFEKVCQLNKSLYGLKQAPLIWNETMNSFLEKIGFKRSLSEYGLYMRRSVIIGLYVDDLLIAGDNQNEIKEIKGQLSAQFKMKDLGIARKFLGINITQGSDGIKADLRDYIDKILEEFGMENCNLVSTPGLPGLKLENNETALLENPTLYRSIVGKLLYASNTVRGDISFITGVLSRYFKEPREAHLTAAKHVLRYLKGTRSLGQRYSKTGQLEVFVDADWGSSTDNRKSITGYAVKFGGGLISWKSKKQAIVATSTTEAEYIALAEAVKEVLWLRTLFGELQIPLTLPIGIHEDNVSCIKLSEHPTVHSRTKHIDIRYHFIRERIKEETIKLIPKAPATSPIWNTRCYTCSGKGHRSNVCTSPVLKCTNCLGNGHKATSCPSPVRTGHFSSSRTSSSPRVHSFSTAAGDAFASTPSTQAYSLNVSPSMVLASTDFLIDSGASYHICNDPTLFWDFKPTVSSKAGSIFGANGAPLPVCGSGTVKFLAGKTPVELHDVYYVPGCARNLVSLAVAAARSKSNFNFSPTAVSHPVLGLVGSVLPDSNLYKFTLSLVRPPAPVHALSVLHDRLGHPHAALEKTIISKYDLASYSPAACESCNVAKSTRHVPKSSIATVTTAPLQLLHSDVSGPHFPKSSYRPEKYFLIIVDDFTKLKWVIPIAQKSEVSAQLIRHIKLFHSFFSTRGGYRVGSIRTDNGGEYVNSTLTKFLQDEGISHQRTVPYNSHQNGTAERATRTILDKARTLSTHGSVPAVFWPYAVVCAAYLINRQPSLQAPFVSPYERWFQIRPVIAHLRPYGCAAYAHIPESHRPSKFSERAITGVMLGYDGSRHAYLIYEMHSRKVVCSNAVTFNESLFPFASSPGLPVPSSTVSPVSTVSMPISSISVSLPGGVSAPPIPVRSMLSPISDLSSDDVALADDAAMADDDTIVDNGTVIDDVVSPVASKSLVASKQLVASKSADDGASADDSARVADDYVMDDETMSLAPIPSCSDYDSCYSYDSDISPEADDDETLPIQPTTVISPVSSRASSNASSRPQRLAGPALPLLLTHESNSGGKQIQIHSKSHALGRTYDTPNMNQEEINELRLTKHKLTPVPSYDNAVAHKKVRIEYISDYEGGSPESLNDDPNDEDYQMS